MDIAIIRGTNDKPGASKLLEDAVRQWAQSAGAKSTVSGKLYIGHPVIATPDGPRRIDALLASNSHGFVAFDLVEGDTIADHKQRQDDFANAIESRLRTQRKLVRRGKGQRRLLVPVNAVSFAPSVHNPPQNAKYPVTNASTLSKYLDDLAGAVSKPRAFELAMSLLESMSTIRRPVRDRPASSLHSRGAALRKLERAVATLDVHQARAVIETADGVQRIRGLAGSGKTIVLAQKAAYLHARHPDWRIAVTFYTRSLKDCFRDLVTRFYVNQTTELPNWEHLRIVHAWGGRSSTNSGIYREFCTTNDATYLDFSAAKLLATPSDAFQEACRRALDEVEEPEAAFDAILVDEAQDVPEEFLALCYRSLTKAKRLIYAYDELQNLDRDSVQAPRDIFGPDVRWREDEPESDVVLQKCYRTSRPVLTTAHALGFGIHRKPEGDETTGIVQMFDDVRMWQDVGYVASTDDIRHDTPVVFRRTNYTSPKFLEDPASIDDLVMFRAFADSSEQAEWIVEQICKNLADDGLLPEDVIVIHPDPSSLLVSTASMRAQLLKREVQSHLAGKSTKPDEFLRGGSVTFTGIHRAKGHEAGMVYIVNAHDCVAATQGLARQRNILFAAITRSKAWVRICGIGDGIAQLADEHATLKKDDYRLRFRYPTKKELKTMRVIHSDIPEGDTEWSEGRDAKARRALAYIEKQNISLEDILALQPVSRQLEAAREGGRRYDSS